MVSRISVLCGAVWACSGQGADTAGEGALPVAEQQYFIGNSIWSSPEGEPVGEDGWVWLRRALHPSTSRVYEDLVSIDGSGNMSHYRVEFVVEEASFWGSFVQDGATIRVEGVLEGDDWNWLGWSATGTYVDGDMAGYYFRSTANLNEAGLSMDKRIYDADDRYLLNIVESLSMVDASVWDAEVSALGIDLSNEFTKR